MTTTKTLSDDLCDCRVLKSLLRRACEVDAREDCWFDHNGGCQAHGFLSEPCPYPLIRQYLRGEVAAPAPTDEREPCIAPPGNLCTETGCWDMDRCVLRRPMTRQEARAEVCRRFCSVDGTAHDDVCIALMSAGETA